MDTSIYELDAGQTLHLALRRGDGLRVQRGRLVAQPRAAWLGDSLVMRRETWAEAHAFEADGADEWQCQALAPTTLVLRRRRGLLHGLGAAVRRWAGLIATAAPAARPPAAPRPTPSASAARCAGTPAR